jgi:hypothetical protein
MTNTSLHEDWHFDENKDYLGDYDKVNRRYSRLQIRSSLRSMCDHIHRDHEALLHYDLNNSLQVNNYTECFIDLTSTIDQTQWRTDYDLYQLKNGKRSPSVALPELPGSIDTSDISCSNEINDLQNSEIVVTRSINTFQTPENISVSSLQNNHVLNKLEHHPSAIIPFSFRRKRMLLPECQTPKWSTPNNLNHKKVMSPDHVSYGNSPNPKAKSVKCISFSEDKKHIQSYMERQALFEPTYFDDRAVNDMSPVSVKSPTSQPVCKAIPCKLLEEYCCLNPDNVICIEEPNVNLMNDEKSMDNTIPHKVAPNSNILTRRPHKQVLIDHVSVKWDIGKQLKRHKLNLVKLLSNSTAYCKYSTWTNYKQLFSALETDTADVASAMAKCNNKNSREKFRQG